jgi:hypothetical protein
LEHQTDLEKPPAAGRRTEINDPQKGLDAERLETEHSALNGDTPNPEIVAIARRKAAKIAGFFDLTPFARGNPPLEGY